MKIATDKAIALSASRDRSGPCPLDRARHDLAAYLGPLRLSALRSVERSAGRFFWLAPMRLRTLSAPSVTTSIWRPGSQWAQRCPDLGMRVLPGFSRAATTRWEAIGKRGYIPRLLSRALPGLFSKGPDCHRRRLLIRPGSGFKPARAFPFPPPNRPMSSAARRP
jgi:hypothetical protein